MNRGDLLVIACGAIARELVQLKKLNQWNHMEIQCLPADLHNTPGRIPAAVEELISASLNHYREIFVAYADCGTGGLLDQLLESHGIQRLPGAHCYEFFAGSDLFLELANEEPGTYYLTDFLVHAFERLVKKGLGLDRYPQLRDQYFANYRRVVYLAQSDSLELQDLAKEHARYLGLDYEYRYCGLDRLKQAMKLNIALEASWPS